MIDVPATARRWIGTPYRHGAAVRGAGTDCLGLIRGVWREAIGAEPEPVPAYTADWDEPQGREVLAQAAARWLAPVPDARPMRAGEVLLFRMRDGSVAKHLGILTATGERPRFVHAYSGRGVVETSLSQPWRRRVAARFDYPVEN